MKDGIFSPAFIEELKAKNDIVNIVGKYVRLEKKGKNFWGCCPFHHEKTPSFCINEYEQFYHCFGCGESGDVISFLRKYENMEYIDVIRTLAENAGMELPKMDNSEKFQAEKRSRDRSLEILALAKDFYKQSLYLPVAKKAQDYIRSRNLTRKELEGFELGFSPNYYDIVNMLKKRGFSDEELKESGVCEIGQSGKPYDFLSERLVFPICNAQGDCIGFSGRNLVSGSSQMKYKNTGATQVFNKSKAIYGINLIKKLRQEKGLNAIILVEGQFDVITMHRYGFENAVACLGTAVTESHVRELKRFADNIVLCLDGDSAGQKATLRTLEVFSAFPEISVKVVALPNSADPDEFLKTYGAEEMQKLISEALTPTAFKIRVIKAKYNIQKLDERTKFLKESLSEISRLSSAAEQDVYLAHLSRLTNISIDILRRDLGTRPERKTEEKVNASSSFSDKDATAKAVEFVLAALLDKKPYAFFGKNLKTFITNPHLARLYDIMYEKHILGETFLKSSVFTIFDDLAKQSPLKDIINYNFEIEDNPEGKYFDCLKQMVKSHLEFRKSTLSKQYMEEIDSAKKFEIIQEINKIGTKLKGLSKENLGEFIDE